jgi:hypothetical protein
MNNELDGIWKEAVTAQFEVLSRHLPGGTEDKSEKPQSVSLSRVGWTYCHLSQLVMFLSMEGLCDNEYG